MLYAWLLDYMESALSFGIKWPRSSPQSTAGFLEISFAPNALLVEIYVLACGLKSPLGTTAAVMENPLRWRGRNQWGIHWSTDCRRRQTKSGVRFLLKLWTKLMITYPKVFQTNVCWGSKRWPAVVVCLWVDMVRRVRNASLYFHQKCEGMKNKDNFLIMTWSVVQNMHFQSW